MAIAHQLPWLPSDLNNDERATEIRSDRQAAEWVLAAGQGALQARGD